MPFEAPPAIICQAPRAIDGDTIACANFKTRVRLAGIDAPEMPGHCRRGRTCTPGDRYAAQAALQALLARAPVRVAPTGTDRYRRLVARVSVAGMDVSCGMIASHHAARRYSPAPC